MLVDHPPSIEAALGRRESQSGRRSDPGQHLLREISGQYQIGKLEISSTLRVASSHWSRFWNSMCEFMPRDCINAFDEIRENLNKEVGF